MVAAHRFPAVILPVIFFAGMVHAGLFQPFCAERLSRQTPEANLLLLFNADGSLQYVAGGTYVEHCDEFYLEETGVWSCCKSYKPETVFFSIPAQFALAGIKLTEPLQDTESARYKLTFFKKTDAGWAVDPMGKPPRYRPAGKPTPAEELLEKTGIAIPEAANSSETESEKKTITWYDGFFVPFIGSAKKTPAPETSEMRGPCPEGMVIIPEGSFMMGDDGKRSGKDEGPIHKVRLGAYCIDRYEYEGKVAGRPQVSRSWFEARDACAAQNKRLCTEAEWERACRGPDGTRWPYGDKYDKRKCNDFQEDTGPYIGKWKGCTNAYGAMDMSGNVWEWTADWYDSKYYERSPESSPEGPSEGKYKVVRGGAWNNTYFNSRCGARSKFSPKSRYYDRGFRCCYSP